ncbi:hypothetical protein D8B26_003573 [Coccidioides posadasii str. Silveira]|uniref:Uncharacterized protein n=2 Tax=Coccidioides posadasii TaxID=199306 RepID=E9D0T3_COCPS|nr:conserved hypothetical protein [Coccidioides posadasii str. Silveira]KMM73493.1 hypothetical protein CPAG_09781 [Coccidioides posadasii RMSCC 3488]QVM08902.1 hypothetical protein D8B26_003573 [Coccidioides posadasii str. Silveira]
MLHLSDSFVISAGTVAIDIFKNVVLVLYSPSIQKYFLPKGRKDIHESLHDTAVRETLEESGYAVKLLPHKLATNAVHAHRPPERDPVVNSTSTDPVSGAQDVAHLPLAGGSAAPPCPAPPCTILGRNNNHPVCGHQPVSACAESTGIPQRERSTGHLEPLEWHIEPIAVQQRAYQHSYKLIFWYLAEVDSEKSPIEAPREAWEDYEVCWVPAEEAAGKVTREEDGKIIEWALEGARGVKAERNVGGVPAEA